MKLNVRTPGDPAALLQPEVHKRVQEMTCVRTFTAALFLITQKPSERKMGKASPSHREEHASNEREPSTTTGNNTDLPNVTPHCMSQTRRGHAV